MTQKHLNWERVLNVLESSGDFAPEEELHCQNCLQCAQILEDVQGTLKLFSDSKDLQPSTEFIDKTLSLLQTVSSESTEAPNQDRLRDAMNNVMRRFSARLTAGVTAVWADLKMDSLQAGAAFRGVDLASPRMLSYETPNYSITISLEQNEAGALKKIAGQVAPINRPNLPSGGVVTMEGDKNLIDCPLSKFGEFTFKEPGKDMDELNILIEGSIIRIMLPPDSDA